MINWTHWPAPARTRLGTPPHGVKQGGTSRVASAVEQWVDEIARTTRPDKIHWCDGSDAENERLTQELLSRRELTKLNEKAYPNSYLARSHPSDVARTEKLTFIVTDNQEDVGPTNNWMSPRTPRIGCGRCSTAACRAA